MDSKLTKCCRKPYKVIFVDVNMPLMGGFQVSLPKQLKLIDDAGAERKTKAWVNALIQ